MAITLQEMQETLNTFNKRVESINATSEKVFANLEVANHLLEEYYDEQISQLKLDKDEVGTNKRDFIESKIAEWNINPKSVVMQVSGKDVTAEEIKRNFERGLRDKEKERATLLENLQPASRGILKNRTNLSTEFLEKIDTMQKELDTEKVELDNGQVAIEEERATSRLALETTLADLGVDDYDEGKRKLTEQQEAIQKEIEKKEKEVKEIEDLLTEQEQVRSTHYKLKDEYELNKVQIEDLKKEMYDLDKELAVLKAQDPRDDKKIEELEKKISQLETQIGTLKDRNKDIMDNLIPKNSERAEEIRTLLKERGILPLDFEKEQIKELKEKANEVSEKEKRLDEQNDELQDKEKETQKKQEEWQKKKDMYQEKLETLKTLKDENEEKAKLAFEQLEKLKKEFEKAGIEFTVEERRQEEDAKRDFNNRERNNANNRDHSQRQNDGDESVVPNNRHSGPGVIPNQAGGHGSVVAGQTATTTNGEKKEPVLKTEFERDEKKMEEVLRDARKEHLAKELEVYLRGKEKKLTAFSKIIYELPEEEREEFFQYHFNDIVEQADKMKPLDKKVLHQLLQMSQVKNGVPDKEEFEEVANEINLSDAIHYESLFSSEMTKPFDEISETTIVEMKEVMLELEEKLSRNEITKEQYLKFDKTIGSFVKRASLMELVRDERRLFNKGKSHTKEQATDILGSAYAHQNILDLKPEKEQDAPESDTQGNKSFAQRLSSGELVKTPEELAEERLGPQSSRGPQSRPQPDRHSHR